MKRHADIKHTLTFEDVLLAPAESTITPADVSTKTRLTRSISLGIPLVAAGVDTVTESAMAVAIAQLGGIGVIHCNMPVGKQVEEVSRVKRAHSLVIHSPITISPDSSVSEALDLFTTYKISALPVIDPSTQKAIGIVTSRDLQFYTEFSAPVTEIMSKDLITVPVGVDIDDAKKLLHKHRIEKLVVVDGQGRCAGMITVNDIRKTERFPQAALDAQGRLLVGASVGTGKDAFERAMAMTDAGLDVVFIDAAHGHTRDVAGTVSLIRQQRSSEVQIVAGNVATPEAARSLIDAGADAIKIGLGPTTPAARIVGVGVPSFSATVEIAEVCNMMDIPVILGGSRVEDTATLAKAIGAGASAVVIDRLFAGTDEAPGTIVYHGLAAYKVVNPQAKPQRRPGFTTTVAADPYRVDGDAPEMSVPYRGAVSHVVAHLLENLKTAMAYTGSRDVQAMIENATFVRFAK